MKATQKTLAGILRRALPQTRVFYFCGADEAGAGDAAARVVAQLGQAERVELTGAELKRDPVRLADEARSTSLFGDRRVLFVTMAGDEAHDAIATLIADPVAGWPDRSTVTDTVRELAGAAGLRLGDALAETIAVAAGLDTRIVRSEITKLALYRDASPERPCTVTAEDLAAIGTRTVDDDVSPLVNAALSGMVDRLTHELPRLASGDINPVRLLLAFERRAVLLAGLTARAGSGGNLNAFLDAEINARRVFFREKPDLVVQLHKWRGARIERLLSRLTALHRALLLDSAGAPLRMSQAIVEIARVSAR